MKIWLKLILGFSVIVLLAVIVGFTSIHISQNALRNNIGNNYRMLATGLLDDIDRNIYRRIEALREYCLDSHLQEIISESNEEFEKLYDIPAYINERDREWTSVPKEEITPFMKEIIDRKLSEELRKKTLYFEGKYGSKVFGEIFITNKYGANIAQSNKTTDYYQGDENWWQVSKEQGLYEEDIEYDDSSGIYSINISIGINNNAGDFLGVMKSSLNIQDTISIIRQFKDHAQQKEGPLEYHNHDLRDGIIAKLNSSGQRPGYVLIKPGSNKRYIELWLAHDIGFTQPFDLPLDSVIQMNFCGDDNHSIELRVRDTVNNEDENGHANIRNFKTNYFIFTEDTGTEASWSTGVDFNSPVEVRFPHDGETYSSNTITLAPHTHANPDYQENIGKIQLVLINKIGTIIYDSEGIKFPEKISEAIFAKLQEGYEESKCFIIENDKPGEGDELFSHAHSAGYRDYKGLGWILLLKHNTKEIFAPVARLRTLLRVLFSVFAVIATLIGIYISDSISKPLKKLARAVSKIGEGKLSTRVVFQSKNEIGLLADSINKMAGDLQNVQSQLVQNEKLASIGQLAAGVAHEMNTPVGFVAGNFQTLESHLKKILGLFAMHDKLAGQVEISENPQLRTIVDGIGQFRDDMQIDFILEDIQRLLDDSREGLDRTVEIIQNLRDFSRIDQPGSRDKYDLNKGIKATLVVAGNEIKYDADVKTEFSEVPLFFCRSGQINQVLLNILVNAAQAIKSQERDDRGTITIRTYASDDRVVCEISDDGPGIPPDKISKVFDPFFTTKPPGKGTGLGLSVSYGIIVNKHNGELLVDSTVGEGTKFTINLPISTKENDEDEEEIMIYGKENSIICGR